MNALLVYPKFPDTFWSFKHALKFVSKRAAQPPLGLITVAAMLPDTWRLRLVDMNVAPLRDKDLRRADIALISAMTVQRASASDVIARCADAGVRTVAGGPLFTANPEDYAEVDHLVLNEAEATLPRFLADFERGRADHCYRSDEFLELGRTPIPRYELLDMRKYASMNIQYSRGCPYHCEFCDISVLFGRKVRTKPSERMIGELDRLYALGWRGDVFFVDDNFIGHKRKLKTETLPALIDWMKAHKNPFNFSTETSIDLGDDEELTSLMVEGGFDSVFVGIETIDDDALSECGKLQNRNRDMLACVKRIQKSGLQVTAGFILGFDSDRPSVFERLRIFIQTSGVASAMVGLLNAPKHTRLYHRLEEEGRLVADPTGDNTDLSMNFEPRMDRQTLLNGYGNVVAGIYAPAPYYERVMRFLREFSPPRRKRRQRQGPRWLIGRAVALAKANVRLGFIGRERVHYWRLFFWTLFTRPRLLPLAVTLAITGQTNPSDNTPSSSDPVLSHRRRDIAAKSLLGRAGERQSEDHHHLPHLDVFSLDLEAQVTGSQVGGNRVVPGQVALARVQRVPCLVVLRPRDTPRPGHMRTHVHGYPGKAGLTNGKLVGPTRTEADRLSATALGVHDVGLIQVAVGIELNDWARGDPDRQVVFP